MYGENEMPDQGTGGNSGGGDWVGALVNAGAGLYDSYQNRKTSKQNTDKTIAANKAESELAYQRSIEEWHRQNMYNSPEAQMARFKQAGLNPHLIYGQGNSGNASGPPSYAPANMQYKYEAPAYGHSIASILPTLMSVGTWMQNMRLTEQEIESKGTNIDRTRQLIEYLEKANPKALAGMENKLSLFPYQESLQRTTADRSMQTLNQMEQEFRQQYGEELFQDSPSAFTGQKTRAPIGGIKRLQFLQEVSKTKLADAKSSWSEFNITDPQQIIQLVVSGIMGLAGQTMRLSTHRGKSAPSVKDRPKGLRRVHPSRRVQASHPYSD